MVQSLDGIVDVLAQTRPDCEASRDRFSLEAGRSSSFRHLRDDSFTIARSLSLRLNSGVSDPLCKRPVGICMTRGSGWLSAFIALVRLGVPVVPMTQDISDSAAMEARNSVIVTCLHPILVVCDSSTPQSVKELCASNSVPVIDIKDLLNPNPTPNQPISRLRDISRVPLAYLYTGGTTGGCKCVQVSHGMAMHEMDGYKQLLPPSSSSPDIVLQNSSSYWGATFLGQINIGLALGACIVFSDNPTDLTPIIESERITIIGLVPSQLRALSGPCPALRTIFTWGEKLPENLAKKWIKSKTTQVIELLVSTEYWLSLFALNGSSEFTVLESPNVDVKIFANELCIGGQCVTPFGYTDDTINRTAFITIEGKRYFKTNDLVSVTRTGKLKFSGRSDNLVKIGGEWRDLLSIETALRELKGVEDVALLPVSSTGIYGAKPVVFVVMSRGPMTQFSNIRKIVNEEYVRLVFVHKIPRNFVTGKVDRRALIEHQSVGSLSKSSAPARRKRTCIIWSLIIITFASYLFVVGSIFSLFVFPYIVILFLNCSRSRFPAIQRILNWPNSIGHIFWSLVLFTIFPTYLSMSIACIGFWVRKNDLSWPIIFWFGLARQVEKWMRNLLKDHRTVGLRMSGRTLSMSSQNELNRVDREWIVEPENQFEKFSKIEFYDYEIDEIFSRIRDFVGDEPMDETNTTDSGLMSTSIDSPLYEPLISLLEKNCDMLPKPICGTTSLSGLSSLVAVILANSIRDVLERHVVVADILKCELVKDLLICVESSPEKKFSNSSPGGQDSNGNRKISSKSCESYNCQLWGWGLPCMWLFEAPAGSYIHYKSLRQALGIISDRHSAFRAIPSDPHPLFHYMNDVFVTFGLMKWMMASSNIASRILSFLGSRIFHGSAQVGTRDTKKFYLGWNETVFHSTAEMKAYLSKGFRPPVSAEILTLEEPGKQRRNFLRLYLTHAFSDGSCVVPILEELNKLYGKIFRGESIEDDVATRPADGLRIQESRLYGALVHESPSHDDLYLCYNIDTAPIFSEGFGETLIMEESFVMICHAACARMNCSIDVLFLSGIVCALARLDEYQPMIPLSLIVPLRDSPGGASDAVGFLADLRNIDIVIGSREFASFLSIVQSVIEIRRNRKWTIPDPFSSSERVLVNIVPAANIGPEKFFTQELGIQQSPGRSAVAQMGRPMEVCLEQVSRMKWTFRSRCRLSDWGDEKFSNFVHLFKQCIVDILVDPNQLITNSLCRSHGS